MPNIKEHRKEIYNLVDGVTELVEVIEEKVLEATQAEILAEKEAELLKIYQEIQALKETK